MRRLRFMCGRIIYTRVTPTNGHMSPWPVDSICDPEFQFRFRTKLFVARHEPNTFQSHADFFEMSIRVYHLPKPKKAVIIQKLFDMTLFAD